MIRSALFVGAIVVSSPAWSAFNNMFVASVPTLDEVGLGALIALVAGVAGWAVRKRSGRK
ncbi:MAG: IPTL-CTERM sorting domain-containing protein [Betaproteobacteria bacterium]|nr:IPTL-CTERM sorting domain-containing protein [Betaproteobacteria bacterium]